MRMNSALKLVGIAMSMAAFGCQLPSDQEEKNSKRAGSESEDSTPPTVQTTEASAEDIESSLALRGYWLGIGNISLQAGISIGIGVGGGVNVGGKPQVTTPTVVTPPIVNPSTVINTGRITSKMVIRLIDGDSLPVINGQMTVVRMDATGNARQYTVSNPNSNVYSLVLAAGQNYQLLAQGSGFSSTVKNLFFDSAKPVSVEFDVKVYRNGTTGDCLLGNPNTNGIIDLSATTPYPDCATPIPTNPTIPLPTNPGTVNTGWKMRHCEDAINGTIDYPETLLQRLMQSQLFQTSMAARITTQALSLKACRFDASRYLATLDFGNASGAVVRVSVQIAGQFDDLLYRDPTAPIPSTTIPSDLVNGKLKFCDVRSGDNVADMNGLRLILLSAVPNEAPGMADLSNLFNTGHTLVDCASRYPDVTLYLSESATGVATKKVILSGAYQYLQTHIVSGLTTTTTVTGP